MIPQVASKLVPWSTTFRDVLVASPGNFFYDPADLVPLTSATNLFLSAQLAVANPEARSGALILARNNAQAAYYEVARPMYDAIQSNPNITDENKALAGVHVKDSTPTPIPVPNSKPLVSVIQVSGSVATLTIRDIDNQDKRARPLGAAGANLFSFVGENAPTTPDQWKFEGQVTKTKFELQLGQTLPAATKVWITACWYSARGETGPASDPIFTFTQAGGTTVQFGVMKMAA